MIIQYLWIVKGKSRVNKHVKGKSKFVCVCVCCPPRINDYSSERFCLLAGQGVEGLFRFRADHLQPDQI